MKYEPIQCCVMQILEVVHIQINSFRHNFSSWVLFKPLQQKWAQPNDKSQSNITWLRTFTLFIHNIIYSDSDENLFDIVHSFLVRFLLLPLRFLMLKRKLQLFKCKLQFGSTQQYRNRPPVQVHKFVSFYKIHNFLY